MTLKFEDVVYELVRNLILLVKSVQLCKNGILVKYEVQVDWLKEIEYNFSRFLVNHVLPIASLQLCIVMNMFVNKHDTIDSPANQSHIFNTTVDKDKLICWTSCVEVLFIYHL